MENRLGKYLYKYYDKAIQNKQNKEIEDLKNCILLSKNMVEDSISKNLKNRSNNNNNLEIEKEIKHERVKLKSHIDIDLSPNSSIIIERVDNIKRVDDQIQASLDNVQLDRLKLFIQLCHNKNHSVSKLNQNISNIKKGTSKKAKSNLSDQSPTKKSNTNLSNQGKNYSLDNIITLTNNVNQLNKLIADSDININAVNYEKDNKNNRKLFEYMKLTKNTNSYFHKQDSQNISLNNAINSTERLNKRKFLHSLVCDDNNDNNLILKGRNIVREESIINEDVTVLSKFNEFLKDDNSSIFIGKSFDSELNNENTGTVMVSQSLIKKQQATKNNVSVMNNSNNKSEDRTEYSNIINCKKSNEIIKKKVIDLKFEMKAKSYEKMNFKKFEKTFFSQESHEKTKKSSILFQLLDYNLRSILKSNRNLKFLVLSNLLAEKKQIVTKFSNLYSNILELKNSILSIKPPYDDSKINEIYIDIKIVFQFKKTFSFEINTPMSFGFDYMVEADNKIKGLNNSFFFLYSNSEKSINTWICTETFSSAETITYLQPDLKIRNSDLVSFIISIKSNYGLMKNICFTPFEVYLKKEDSPKIIQTKKIKPRPSILEDSPKRIKLNKQGKFISHYEDQDMNIFTSKPKINPSKTSNSNITDNAYKIKYISNNYIDATPEIEFIKNFWKQILVEETFLVFIRTNSKAINLKKREAEYLFKFQLQLFKSVGSKLKIINLSYDFIGYFLFKIEFEANEEGEIKFKICSNRELKISIKNSVIIKNLTKQGSIVDTSNIELKIKDKLILYVMKEPLSKNEDLDLSILA